MEALEHIEEKLGCLLWMDDVILITLNAEELQKMLNITYKIASIYHIEFGEKKSKILTIGPTKKLPVFKLRRRPYPKNMGCIQIHWINLQYQIQPL